MDRSSRPTAHRARSLLIGGAALLLAAVGWWSLTGARSDSAATPHETSAVAVDAASATRADVPIYLEGLGTVQAFNTVTVTARVDGEIEKIGFVEGQIVHRGDLLAQIDPRPFQAAVGQARAAKLKDEAQLQSARADFERYKRLAPENLASKQTLDAQQALVSGLEASVKGDQAHIEDAVTQLEYATITSPIDGRTGIRRVDAGNNVHATDTTGIVVVTQVQPIALIFTLPEEALPTVNDAMSAGTVSVAALSRDGTREFDRGTIALIDNQIDQTTGTIRLKAVFPNEKNTLWPGEFVDARVLVRTVHDAVTIPSAAVQRGPQGMFTYVIKPDMTVEARPLSGEESGPLLMVRSGLRAGERVVTSNQYRLEPGAHVRVTGPPATTGRVGGTPGAPSASPGAGSPGAPSGSPSAGSPGAPSASPVAGSDGRPIRPAAAP